MRSICLIFLCTSATSLAADREVSSDNQTRHVRCKEAGETVRIAGNSNAVAVSGSCGVVTVEGSSNVVTVEGLTRLVVRGNSHVVTWQRNLSDARTLSVDNDSDNSIVSKAPRLPRQR